MGSRALVGSSMSRTSGLVARARAAKALLLASGEAQTALVELVLDLVPESSLAERALEDLVRLGASEAHHAVEAVEDVVADAHRERVGVLEDHAHVDAQCVGVHRKDILAGELNRALVVHGLNEVAHAVERAEQRRLSAARGADEGGAATLGDVERDVLQGLEVPIPEIEVARVNGGWGVRDRTMVRLGELLLHQIIQTFR